MAENGFLTTTAICEEYIKCKGLLGTLIATRKLRWPLLGCACPHLTMELEGGCNCRARVGNTHRLLAAAVGLSKYQVELFGCNKRKSWHAKVWRNFYMVAQSSRARGHSNFFKYQHFTQTAAANFGVCQVATYKINATLWRPPGRGLG